MQKCNPSGSMENGRTYAVRFFFARFRENTSDKLQGFGDRVPNYDV